MPIPLIWEIQVNGAENLKAKLKDIDTQLKAGTITEADATKQTIALNREMASLGRLSNISTNEFKAMHPALTQLSRGMSALHSVMGSVVQVQQLYNLANLVTGQKTSDMIKIEGDLRNARLLSRDALERYGKSSVQYLNAIESQTSLEAQQSAQEKQLAADRFNSMLTFASGAIFLGSSVLQVLPRLTQLAANFDTVAVAVRGLTAAMLPLLVASGPFVLIAAAIALVAELAISLGAALEIPQFVSLQNQISSVIPWFSTMSDSWKDLIDKFTSAGPVLGNIVKFFTDLTFVAQSQLSTSFRNLVVIFENINTALSNSINISSVFNALFNTFALIGTVLNDGITKFKSFVAALTFTIPTSITTLATTFSGIGTSISGAVTQISSFVTKLAFSIPTSLTTIANTFGTLGTSIGTAITNIGKFVSALIISIPASFTTAITTLQNLFNSINISTSVLNGISTLKGLLTTAVSSGINTAIDAVRNLFQLGSGAISTIQNAIFQIISLLSKSVDAGLNTIVNSIKNLLTIGSGVITTIIQAIQALIGLLVGSGKSSVQASPTFSTSQTLLTPITNTNKTSQIIINLTQYVSGSVVGERELFDKVDAELTARLKTKGF
jgi:phage-related protein